MQFSSDFGFGGPTAASPSSPDEEFGSSFSDLINLQAAQQKQLDLLRERKTAMIAAVEEAKGKSDELRRKRLYLLGVCTSLEQELDNIKDAIHFAKSGSMLFLGAVGARFSLSFALVVLQSRIGCKITSIP
jgi:hypothetical protein